MNTKLSLCPTYTYHSHSAMVSATCATVTAYLSGEAAEARTLLEALSRHPAMAMTGIAVPLHATRHTFKSKYRRTYTEGAAIQGAADCHARPHAVDAVCYDITISVFAICCPCLTAKCVADVCVVVASIPTKVVTTA